MRAARGTPMVLDSHRGLGGEGLKPYWTQIDEWAYRLTHFDEFYRVFDVYIDMVPINARLAV